MTEWPWVLLWVPHLQIYFYVIVKENGWIIVQSALNYDIQMVRWRYFFFFYLKNTCHFFVDYTSKQHKCLKFTSEAENHNTFSFLNIKITRHSQQFRTPVYIKPTFSGIFTHCESYLDQTYWTPLVNTLLFRWFLIWSDYTLFHLKVENLRKNLKKE